MRDKTLATMKVMAGALALTMGLSVMAAAQPARGGRGFGGHGFRGPGGPGGGALGGLLGVHPDLPLGALKLTDAQREQVRGILQSHRSEAESLRQRSDAAHEALRAATTASTVDEAAIAQQGQAFGALIADAAVLRAKVRSEVLAVLTPEQQAEATKIAADRQTRMQERRTRMQQRRQQQQKK